MEEDHQHLETDFVDLNFIPEHIIHNKSTLAQVMTKPIHAALIMTQFNDPYMRHPFQLLSAVALVI